MTTLEILRTGPLALVQDLGRVGLAHLGVGRSGAADRRSHTLANRLVANPDDRATIEVTMGGFAARVRGGDIDIAVTGADTDPAVDGTMFGANSIQHVRDGELISLGIPRSGLRSYLAVRGGIDVDTGAGLAQLRRDVGDRAVAAAARRRAAGRRTYRRVPRTRPGSGRGRSPTAGRTAWWCPGHATTGSSMPTAWCTPIWMASDRSDRVGMRLEGRPLQYRYPDRQLPSEGATRGAIQVPPNGLPVILGPDHPVTGGYPVVGVVADDDIDKVAQVRPGQQVRLHWVTAPVATTRCRVRRPRWDRHW